MSQYLEVNENGEAIGGVYNVPTGEPIPDGWVAMSGDASLGWVWDSAAGVWDKPKITLEQLTEHRDKLLSDTDWRDLPSYPKSDQLGWRRYRQELRDLPNGYIPTSDPAYPEEPK